MAETLQWQCPICTAANDLDKPQCWACNGQRPQQQYQMLLEIMEQQIAIHKQQFNKQANPQKNEEDMGLEEDNDIDMNGLDIDDKNDGEIRIRLCDQLFSLNLSIIQLSPFLCKFHNGDMQKFIELEGLLYDLIPQNFNINIPIEICSLITECFHIQIPEIPSKYVDIKTFNKIIQYLQYHYDTKKVSNFQFPLKDRYNMNEFITDEFDVEFVNEDNQFILSKLALAANYLDIKPLYHLVCVQIAIKNRGKQPYDVMQDTFGAETFKTVCSICPRDWFSYQ